VLAGHAAGRLREALAPRRPPAPEDFLAAASGTVAGRRGALRRAVDRGLDALEVASGRRARLRRAARRSPRRRVLVVGAHRAPVPALEARLAASRHDVVLDLRPAGERGKFENLNAILADHDLDGFDWVVAVDDDVSVPRGFLDGLVFLAERFGLVLAQPAQSLASHAAWSVVRRRPGAVARRTTFVEIGPVTAFARPTFARLLPFPDLRMAWGLDLHWAAIARDAGWSVGVIDAVPVRHERAAVAAGYSREDAIAEARAFLDGRPHLVRDEVATLATHRRW
jgi:hypothetical protein